MSSRGASRRCTATKADGSPCRAWATRGSDPPLCGAHLGRVGAPEGNQNARKHGAYARPVKEITCIEDAVKDLEYRLTGLTRWLDDADLADSLAALSLYRQMVSGYGRLLRDSRAVQGKSAESILDLIATAVDELSTEMGWEAFDELK